MDESFLIDNPEDGCLEEYGWLPGDAAVDRAAAVVEFETRFRSVYGWLPWRDEAESGEPRRELVCVGREYLVPTFQDTAGRELRGTAAIISARLDGALDGLAFSSKCNEYTEGVSAWWRLELREAVD